MYIWERNMLRKKLDALFWRFADEKFCYTAVWPYYTELVFAFADYVDALPDEELARLLECQNPAHARRLAAAGVDIWLTKNAKTLLIL